MLDDAIPDIPAFTTLPAPPFAESHLTYPATQKRSGRAGSEPTHRKGDRNMTNRKRKKGPNGAFGNSKKPRANKRSARGGKKLTLPAQHVGNALDRWLENDPQGTIASAEQAIALDPNEGAAYVMRGNGKAGLGHHEEAIADYNQAETRQSKVWDQQRLQFATFADRGGSWLALQNYARAIPDFDRAWRLDPNDAHVLLSRGVCKFSLGNYEEAITDFQLSIPLDPQNSHSYFFLGRCKQHLGNPEEASDDFMKAIERNGNDSEAHFEWAMCRLALDDHEQAIDGYERAIASLKGDLPDLVACARYNIGMCRTDLGDFERAAAEFTHFVGVFGNDPDGYYRRAIARLNHGDYVGAITDCEVVRDIAPDYAFNCLGIAGLARGFQGNYQEALSDYAAALKINPDSFRVYHLMSITQAHHGHYQAAISSGDLGIGLEPTWAPMYLDRAWAKINAGETDGAVQDCNTAMELDHQLFVTGHLYRAYAKLRGNDSIGALADFRYATSLDSKGLIPPEAAQTFDFTAEQAERNDQEHRSASDGNEQLEIAQNEIDRLTHATQGLESDFAQERRENADLQREKEDLRKEVEQLKVALRYKDTHSDVAGSTKTPVQPAHEYEIEYYMDGRGRVPYDQWFADLSKRHQQNVASAIDQIKLGNFNDHKPLPRGKGVQERRIVGGGLRIYFARTSARSLLVLGGGSKDTQDDDISDSKDRWREYSDRLELTS